MEAITKYLKEKCIYDRLKDRIRANLKKVNQDPHSKVQAANPYFDQFRSTQDGVLTLYLVWDALDTLRMTHTMYVFRNETGFDPTKITNPHVLNLMHELVRDRRHCDVIVAHTMQWYTLDYTPRADKCCQRSILKGLAKFCGLEGIQSEEAGKVIEKRNLVDGCPSRVTVSIHMDENDIDPKVIEIPRDTAAKNIQIYLKGGAKGKDKDSDSSSDSSCTTTTAPKTQKPPPPRRSRSRSRSRSQDLLGPSNDENGQRKGFRRSPSPSRDSIKLSMKGGGVKNECADGNETDSYSYIHNPELHSLFMEELRKVKDKRNCRTKCDTGRTKAELIKKFDHCQKKIAANPCPQPKPNVEKKCISPVPQPMMFHKPTCTRQPHHFTPVPQRTPNTPHLANQCKQFPIVAIPAHQAQPCRPQQCGPQMPKPKPENNCFHEMVRRGTQDLINSAEVTRRLHDMESCRVDEVINENECHADDDGRGEDHVTMMRNNNQNVNHLRSLCCQMRQLNQQGCQSQQPQGCQNQQRNCAPPQTHPPNQCQIQHNNNSNVHQTQQCSQPRPQRGEPGCHGYQPEVLSEMEMD